MGILWKFNFHAEKEAFYVDLLFEAFYVDLKTFRLTFDKL